MIGSRLNKNISQEELAGNEYSYIDHKDHDNVTYGVVNEEKNEMMITKIQVSLIFVKEKIHQYDRFFSFIISDIVSGVIFTKST